VWLTTIASLEPPEAPTVTTPPEAEIVVLAKASPVFNEYVPAPPVPVPRAVMLIPKSIPVPVKN